MKKYIFIAVVLIFGSCKSKKAVRAPEKKEIATENTTTTSSDKTVLNFEILENEAVNMVQKDLAYQLGKRVLNTCNTSKFRAFSSAEAVQSVRDNTTEIRLTKTCLKFKLRYGDFLDLELQEVIKNNFTNEIIYRYKALYSKKIANKELQIFMNENNQITALKSKDWKDNFID